MARPFPRPFDLRSGRAWPCLHGLKARAAEFLLWGFFGDNIAIVREKGLTQISDTGAIEKAVDEIIAKHHQEVERFRRGDEKLIGFFVGQVMKATKGKANPQMVNDLLKKKLTP